MLNLTDFFNLPGVESVRWVNSRPTFIDEEGDCCASPPEFLCEFSVKGQRYQYFAQYYKRFWQPAFCVYAPVDLESFDCSKLAESIAEIRAFEYAPFSDPPYDSTYNYGWHAFSDLEVYVDDLPLAVIATYRASKPLRESFPRLGAFMQGKNSESGHLYMLTDCQSHYKLGKSRHLDRRIYQLGTQPPFKVEMISSAWMPNMHTAEKALHARYNHCRMNGEWFALTDAEIEDIRVWMARVSDRNQNVRNSYAAGCFLSEKTPEEADSWIQIADKHLEQSGLYFQTSDNGSAIAEPLSDARG